MSCSRCSSKSKSKTSNSNNRRTNSSSTSPFLNDIGKNNSPTYKIRFQIPWSEGLLLPRCFRSDVKSLISPSSSSSSAFVPAMACDESEVALGMAGGSGVLMLDRADLRCISLS